MVIAHFLGPKWAAEHIMAPVGPTTYFRNEGASRDWADDFYLRTGDLGDMLFNLQHVPGFDDCVRRLREGDIEATIAELEAARLIHMSHIKFNFRIPVGVRGQDYDLDIYLPDGTKIAADTKCKLEATELSENAIYNPLHDAIDQLPKDSPGFLFIKAPKIWLHMFKEQGISPAAGRLLQDAIARFFRGTQRVVSVVVFSAPVFENEAFRCMPTVSVQYVNPNHRFSKTTNWTFLYGHDLPLLAAPLTDPRLQPRWRVLWQI